MEIKTKQLLKEIDKWSEIYDFHVLTTFKYKSITVSKNDTELFESNAESLLECYKEALKYVERVNPKHTNNRKLLNPC